MSLGLGVGWWSGGAWWLKWALTRCTLCADLIFKNQAMSSRDKDKEPQFVNDLLRTEFHK